MIKKLLFFYSGHPDVSTAMIIIIIITIIINPNLLLITKLTIKSYLQLISLKKTIQAKHYLYYSFRLKKETIH